MSRTSEPSSVATVVASMDQWSGVGNVPIDQVREWRTILAADAWAMPQTNAILELVNLLQLFAEQCRGYPEAADLVAAYDVMAKGRR